MKLTTVQVGEVSQELITDGVPVRFMCCGASLDILTGETTKRGANVMNQIVYWNFSRKTAQKIAGWLGVRAAFSE